VSRQTIRTNKQINAAISEPEPMYALEPRRRKRIGINVEEFEKRVRS
jgi:hypothetical protein